MKRMSSTIFYLFGIVVLGVFVQSTLAKKSFLHSISSDNSKVGSIRGHILSSSKSGKRATLFSFQHNYPILLWDELQEEGFKYQFINENNLDVHSSKINSNDFLPGTVICFQSRHLIVKPTKFTSFTFLKILESKISVKNRSTIHLITSTVPQRAVISDISFSTHSAKVNARAGKKLRKLHIYGRHGPQPIDSKRKNINEILFSQKFFINPILVCLATVLDDIPIPSFISDEMICDLELEGEVLNFVNDVSTSVQPWNKNSAKKDSVQPKAKFTITMSFYGYGTFDVDNDRLNFSFLYSGRLSSDINCPYEEGCILHQITKSHLVQNYHDLVSTEDGFSVPNYPGFTMESAISVNLSSGFASQVPFSLSSSHPYHFNSSSFNVITDTNVGTPTVKLSMSSNTGAGPWGDVIADVVIDTRFEDSGSRISNALKFNVGNWFEELGNGNYKLPPMKKSIDIYEGTCQTSHKRRFVTKSFMKNISGNLRTLNTHLGFRSQKKSLHKSPSPPLLWICLTPA